MSNTVHNTATLEIKRLRSQLFDLLHNYSISALVLPESKFYHIGTFKELLYHNCSNPSFLNDFRLEACNIVASYVISEKTIPKCCIVEFCRFSRNVSLTDNCILSNCVFDEDFNITIPIFAQTLPLLDGLYVTVFMGTFDDPKKIMNSVFCGVEIEKALGILKLESVNVRSLWDIPIFASYRTPEESFRAMLQIIEALILTRSNHFLNNCKLYSMSQCFQLANSTELVKFRRALLNSL